MLERRRADWYCEAIWLPSVSPGSNHDVGMAEWLPIVWLTAIASPNALPSPSSTAAAIAGRGVGEHDAADRLPAGGAEREGAVGELRRRPENSSRQIADVIGMIMIVSTSGAGRIPAWSARRRRSAGSRGAACPR